MKPTTRKRHPKCDHGVYKDMCDLCKPAPRQIPGQDGVWRQDKKDKARKRTLTVPFQGVPYGKLTRLIAKWRNEADKAELNIYNSDEGCLRRCADELERLLK